MSAADTLRALALLLRATVVEASGDAVMRIAFRGHAGSAQGG